MAPGCRFPICEKATGTSPRASVPLGLGDCRQTFGKCHTSSQGRRNLVYTAVVPPEHIWALPFVLYQLRLGQLVAFPPSNIPLSVPSTSFPARYTGLLVGSFILIPRYVQEPEAFERGYHRLRPLFASLIPAKSASYSAWLLLALKSKCRLCSTNTPFGPSKITPAPLPVWLDDPSTDKYHSPSVCSCSLVSSVMKSASAWALIGPLFSKVISNSDNCTLQATILPAKSGFLNIC
ncbi:hypothetical protein CR513_11352, partial [Mucuna pruriens]